MLEDTLEIPWRIPGASGVMAAMAAAQAGQVGQAQASVALGGGAAVETGHALQLERIVGGDEWR